MKLDLYDEVKYYFQLNFPEAYLIFGSESLDNSRDIFVNNVLMKVREELSNFESMKKEDVKIKLDKILTDFLNMYLTESERKNCRYICEFICEKYKSDESKYGTDIYDHIVKIVSSKIFRRYEYMITDEKSVELLNEEVDKYYKKECNLIKSEVSSIIKFLLSEAILPLDMIKYNINVNDKNLINDIINYIYKKSYGRIFLDLLRKSVVKKDGNIIEVIRGDAINDLSKYINSLIYAKKTDGREKSENSSRKNTKSETQVNSKKSSLGNGNFFEQIFTMRNNSVSNENGNSKLPYNYRTRKMTKPIITLLILTTLISSGYKNFKTNSEEAAVTRVMEFDDFNYGRRYSTQKIDYLYMADNIIDFYESVEHLENENYNMLSFYMAVDSNLSDDDLDKLLRALQTRALERNDQKLKTYFSGKLCYLDFIYERLESMDCKELKNRFVKEKYEEAILAYKHSNMANVYGIPAVGMSKNELKLVNEIKELYKEYCKKYMIELGDMIEYDKDGNLVLSEVYLKSDGGRSK